jgi:pyridoxamine 5'-phosphate oxidase
VDDRARPLLERDVDPDPLRQFETWFREAGSAVRAPEAMAVATAAATGAPSVRMVLLKGFDDRGFVFFTGYDSRKGRELAANPRAALLFYWDPLGRQVRIEGATERVTREESDRYFHARPRASQIAALASEQSRPLTGREALDARVTELAAELEGGEVPLPEAWGGFRLQPVEYEFWQHREDRLHDRLRYFQGDDGWTIERLSP